MKVISNGKNHSCLPCRGVFFGILLLLLSAGAYSQEQVVGIGKGAEEIKVGTIYKQHGSENSTTVAPKLGASKLAAEANHEYFQYYEKPLLDRWLTYSTIFLSAVTFFLALFTAFLWSSTSKLVRGAKDTAERELRAYVCVESSTGAEAAEDRRWPTFKIEVKNFGKTPAFDVVTWIGVGIQEYPLTSEFPEPPDEEPQSKTILGPECKTTLIGIFRRTPNTSEIEAINSGMGAIYIQGRIEYKDAFDKSRFTTFCLVWRGAIKGLQQYKSGNNAN
jgi:hypothetical protein